MVTWDLPTHTNGNINGFILYYRKSKDTSSSQHEISLRPTKRSHLIQSLDVGKEYEIWMTASTSVGVGKRTAVIKTRTMTRSKFDLIKCELVQFVLYFFLPVNIFRQSLALNSPQFGQYPWQILLERRLKRSSVSCISIFACKTGKSLRTTVPLVSYIRNSLRFWYYASLSTCCPNLEKNWGHRENLGESGGQTFKGSDREKCQF